MQNTKPPIVPNDIDKYVTHNYANNNGVNIHYVTIGKGPLIVMIHGFPDFWYTWRNQMVALAPTYQVASLDLRGYKLSDKPRRGENYSMHHLVGDVQAVIRHLGKNKAIIMGHDWGGAIAWQSAIDLRALTERLIIQELLSVNWHRTQSSKSGAPMHVNSNKRDHTSDLLQNCSVPGYMTPSPGNTT